MPELNGNDRKFMRQLLAGKRILIVDDDDDYAEAMDEVFTMQNCNVTRILDPLYGIEEALSQHYDLFIIDKNMPKLNGLEFAQKIKEHKPDAKIILITAYPHEDSRQKSLDIGISYYLPKPFRKNDILEIASFLML